MAMFGQMDGRGTPASKPVSGLGTLDLHLEFWTQEKFRIYNNRNTLGVIPNTLTTNLCFSLINSAGKGYPWMITPVSSTTSTEHPRIDTSAKSMKLHTRKGYSAPV
ncbi:hypothetical protein TNCV_3037371 [Trichonephila clavipes]|nr:hypothetical protein TNCV_3037371 [Trichonephila clavipes]